MFGRIFANVVQMAKESPVGIELSVDTMFDEFALRIDRVKVESRIFASIEITAVDQVTDKLDCTHLPHQTGVERQRIDSVRNCNGGFGHFMDLYGIDLYDQDVLATPCIN